MGWSMRFLLAALLFVSGCGVNSTTAPPETPSPREDTGTTPPPADSATTGDTPAPRDGPLPLEDIPTGTKPDGPVTRDRACSPFDDGVYGQKVPWEGFVYQGTTYSCNTCRGGLERLQGTWRYYDDPDDPRKPDPAEYAETLSFDGNTWTNHLRGDDNGTRVDAVLRGWYFCADQPENDKKVTAFIVTSAEPEGAFGNQSGLVWSADLLEGGRNDMLMFFYDGIATTATDDKHYQYLYCRIGEQVHGQLCADPFE